jgi:uncharacterized protein (DUF1501 family)
MRLTRRSFIRSASLAAAGSAAALRPFGALNALAQNTTDYKALVCVFLFGGNDANNMLIPFDTNGYANYSSIRGSLAIAQSKLLQLGQAPNFALNPGLTNLQGLFGSKTAALVANVGTLIEPTTRAQFLANQSLPSNLFSHSDQQAEWQNATQSSGSNVGWAGRIADVLTPAYNASASIPMVTSVSGDTVFCNGESSQPLSISPGNLGVPSCSEGSKECPAQQESAQALLTFDTGLTLIQADDQITSNAYNYSQLLAAATQSVTPLTTVFPANNALGAQLKQIAQLMQVRSAFGVKRQIFFAGLGSFDTHANQLTAQNNLLAELDAALAAFYQATQELSVQNSVTTFTMSDFARTFQPNSNGGTDHAWGSHHIVMGGAVNGGQLYGTFPTLALGGSDDSGSNGRWIPTTSSAQYGATLAQWFGVGASQLSAIFPTIGNFTNVDLGFV